jgi:hypothetical protein
MEACCIWLAVVNGWGSFAGCSILPVKPVDHAIERNGLLLVIFVGTELPVLPAPHLVA